MVLISTHRCQECVAYCSFEASNPFGGVILRVEYNIRMCGRLVMASGCGEKRREACNLARKESKNRFSRILYRMGRKHIIRDFDSLMLLGYVL